MLTFGASMQLYIEIKGRSLQSCLNKYFASEILDGVENYCCIKYKKKRKATKRLQIHDNPNVLIISLKRFDSNNDKIESIFPNGFGYSKILSDTCRNKYTKV